MGILESAFERGVRVELSVLEPSKRIRTNEVFVEGLENGTLLVSASKESAVMEIPIGDVKAARLVEEEKNFPG